MVELKMGWTEWFLSGFNSNVHNELIGLKVMSHRTGLFG